MSDDVKKTKRALRDALVKENERLSDYVSQLEDGEATRIGDAVKHGHFAVKGLVDAVQTLVKVVPNTKQGRAAILRVQTLFKNSGLPLIGAISKIPKPPKKRGMSKRQSSAQRRHIAAKAHV